MEPSLVLGAFWQQDCQSLKCGLELRVSKTVRPGQLRREWSKGSANSFRMRSANLSSMISGCETDLLVGVRHRRCIRSQHDHQRRLTPAPCFSAHCCDVHHEEGFV